ncbi:MAG: 4'-phosphopantetheinyl transferase superfamily protein [Muribaculaceae bacterium]|nr:4'-phosphopantetheinyl transferase superfamily protein [Muribaculaceae bacterium]
MRVGRLELSDDICVYLCRIAGCGSRREEEQAAVTRLVEAAAGAGSVVSHREDGSPYVEGKDIEISVSHSRSCAALAVSSRGRVGVDIEDNRAEQLRRVAARVLSEAEMDVYGPGATGAVRAWTLKEAAYKAVAGAPADFRRIELPLDADDRYIYVYTDAGTVRAEMVWCAEVPEYGWMSVVSVIP